RIHIGSQIFRFSLPGSDSGIKLEDDDADVGEQVDDVKDVELESGSAPEKTDDDKAPAENEEERIAKIEVDTAGTGRGKLLVRIMEIAGALVVLGAIGAFVVLAGKETTAGPGGVGGSDNTLPVLPGGLLAKNPSFETDGKPGSEGRINHWQSLVTAREDSVVGVADSGKGGRQVMRVERFTQSRSRTFWVCREPFFVPQSGGFDVSVWAKTPRDGASAFLFVEWFVSEEDILPMRRDCRGYTSGLSNWTQITSTFVPPTGARLGRMGVGVTGRAGVVLFDQAKVVKNEAAKPFALASGNPLQVKLSDDGTLAFLDQRGGKASPMLSSVAIELTTPSMAGITVPHHEWLVDAPVAEARDGKLSITFHVFDPESEKARDITVVCDGKIAISASDPLGSSLSALRLVGAASDRFLPSGVVVLQDGRPLHWGREVTSNVAQMVRCADTQNRYAFSADTHVMLSGGTLSFLSHSPEIGVTFHLAD
ncbi:MAG: hypothetical protein L6Q71_12515, partial [Planctomycetes bacterium]|nr:hypothetical protein [Planctomycetota bacterium]